MRHTRNEPRIYPSRARNLIILTSETGLDLSGATGAEYGDNITGSVASGYLTSGTTDIDIGGNH